MKKKLMATTVIFMAVTGIQSSQAATRADLVKLVQTAANDLGTMLVLEQGPSTTFAKIKNYEQNKEFDCSIIVRSAGQLFAAAELEASVSEPIDDISESVSSAVMQLQVASTECHSILTRKKSKQEAQEALDILAGIKN